MANRMRADLPHRDVPIRVRRNIEEHVREILRQRFAELSGRIRQPISAAAWRRLFDRLRSGNGSCLFGNTRHERLNRIGPPQVASASKVPKTMPAPADGNHPFRSMAVTRSDGWRLAVEDCNGLR